MLSKKRYNHSINVADTCFRLAEVYGEDLIKAYTAGILHDIMKEQSPETLLSRVVTSKLHPDPVELLTPALWHAIAGAAYAKQTLGIHDKDIINSIRFHTVGRANMSDLEKIVYLGDLISKDRSFPDVSQFRAYAFELLAPHSAQSAGVYIAYIFKFRFFRCFVHYGRVFFDWVNHDFARSAD